MNKIDSTGFEKIGQTAVWTAYLRGFSDIPFAQELLTELMQSQYSDGSTNKLKKPTMAPQYEARYKILSKLLAESGITQIVELAAGFTGRGLDLALSKEVKYVELEIPEVAAAKRHILQKLSAGLTYHGMLTVVDGNALLLSDIDRATQSFDHQQPLAIINEGLMRYMTFAEKEMLALNILSVLDRFGGVWITPDISLASLLAEEDKTKAGHTAELVHITGKEITKNLFQSAESAQLFFEKLGFSVERHSLLEVTNDLTSPHTLGIELKQVMEMNSPAAIFVMRTAHKITPS